MRRPGDATGALTRLTRALRSGRWRGARPERPSAGGHAMAEAAQDRERSRAAKMPEFLREPHRGGAGAARSSSRRRHSVSSRTSWSGDVRAGRISSRCAQLSRQDWTLPGGEAPQRKLREQGVERRGGAGGTGREFRVGDAGADGRAPGPRDRVPRRGHPRPGRELSRSSTGCAAAESGASAARRTKKSKPAAEV